MGQAGQAGGGTCGCDIPAEGTFGGGGVPEAYRPTLFEAACLDSVRTEMGMAAKTCEIGV